MTDFVLGARLYIASATQAVSYDYVCADDFLYEGRVESFGYSERSVSAPPSSPQIGDCQLRLADTDRKWRDLLSTQTAMRRLIEVVNIVDGSKIGGYEITQLTFGQGYVDVRGWDVASKWMNKQIASLGSYETFPSMTGTPFFFPIL